MDGTGLPELFMFLFIMLIIFLICRELVCWYWKQNEQVALLKDIRNLLRKQIQADYEEPLEDENIAIGIDEEPGVVPEKIFGIRTGAKD